MTSGVPVVNVPYDSALGLVAPPNDEEW